MRCSSKKHDKSDIVELDDGSLWRIQAVCFLADVTALLGGLADKRSSWNCDHQNVMPRTRGTPPLSAAGTWIRP